MKRVLVIDDFALYRDFLKKQLEAYNFEVITAINGLDGLSKMRNEIPDLIIMDYYLSRKSSTELLKDKMNNPNTKHIPVIMASAKIDRQKIMQVAQYNVKKVLSKPIKIDLLFAAVSDVLGESITIDSTPCLLDVHLNDKILFVEIAMGLNTDKINLLEYKVAELLKLYKVPKPRILIMMSDLTFTIDDQSKLDRLLELCLGVVQDEPSQICILTTSDNIKSYATGNFSGVAVVSTLEMAMDQLLGVKGLESMTAEQDNIQETLLGNQQTNEKVEAIHLNFEEEGVTDPSSRLESLEGPYSVAIVDDDFIVHTIVKTVFEKTGWNVTTFENGRTFVDSLNESTFDIIFLDLVMPEMNGFEVLEYLKANDIKLPVIVLSAMTRKESVIKAMSYGVKQYMIKPIKPDDILNKATEILNMNF